MNDLVGMPETLTEREQEILELLDGGLSDREIAYQLTLSLGTVKWYNRQIYDKLGVSSRTQAIAQARRFHLLNSGDDGNNATDSKSTALFAHHLPAQTTQLVGRKDEIAHVQRLLQTVRLLTLTGSPGTGKTRLAIQIAEEIAYDFADGVYFVPLAPLTDASKLANALAGALEVEEIVSEPLLDSLKRRLQSKRVLLILDNFEHVLAGVPIVSSLLASAPRLKVLVTSRALLNLYGEVEYAVPPLALPAVEDDVSVSPSEVACEAVSLFIQRTQAVKPGFELTAENALDIAKICVRLDGLPLGIELAAARMKLLSPRALLERLSNRLETLVGGARDLPSRQQTLRNTLDWSYDLLNDAEKTLLGRLSVFMGGWSLEPAEQVCGAGLTISVLDGLAALIDKSLVQQYDTPYEEPRFMLLEVIREYALERLIESGEADSIRSAHAAYFTDFVERTGKALDTMYRGGGLSRMEIEQNNIRAVLGWSLAGDTEPGLRLIAAVAICWRIRSYMVEGFQWAQQFLEKGSAASPLLRAQALSSAATLLACHLGNFADAEEMSAEALKIAHEHDDHPTLAVAWFARASALIETSPALARVAIENALTFYRDLNDRWELARTINLKGELLRLEGDYKSAKQLYEEALSIFRELGNPWGINIVLNNLAAVARYHSDLESARTLLTDALSISVDLKDRCSISVSLDGLAGILGALKQPYPAAQLMGMADALREMIGAHIHAGDRGDYERNLNLIRTQLDDDDFASAWESGRQMSLADVLEFALNKTAP